VLAQWIRVSGGVAEGDLSCTAGHRVAGRGGTTDGIYAGWQWNGRTLILEQDRYGFFPLFEWRTADAHWVSTDLGTLIERGAPTELDFDALAVFFRIGFFVGSDTPFAPSVPCFLLTPPGRLSRSAGTPQLTASSTCSRPLSHGACRPHPTCSR